MSVSSRSPKAAPSPSKCPTHQDDENTHPKGHCRYILLHASIKGERCGCTGFIRNKTLPGLTCDCGHLAVYHLSGSEVACPQDKPLEKIEMEDIRRRVEALEREKAYEEQADGFAALVTRVGELEHQVESTKEDQAAEIAKTFAQIASTWHHFENLKTRMEEAFLRFDSGFLQMERTVAAVRARQQVLDCDQVDLSDRLDQLEAAEREDDDEEDNDDEEDDRDADRDEPIASRERTEQHVLPLSRGRRRRRSSNTWQSLIPVPPPRPLPFRFSGSQAWTVHVSLLPKATLGMPFEKDTNAYKRCLSRGLHQMVAVQGPDAQSFVFAVQRAFGKLLRGRDWIPLQARLCDAKPLQGLPMVRPLDPSLLDRPYDQDFLKEHCAVCDPNGKIDSLYIAMRSHELSWKFIKRSPVVIEGLEACWEHDPALDDNGEPAGTIMTSSMAASAVTPTSSTSTATTLVAAKATVIPSGTLAAEPPVSGSTGRKRNMSQMSRASSFGAATVICDGDGSRPKMARTCIPPQRG